MKRVTVKKEMFYSLLIPYILLGVVGIIFFGYVYSTSIENINREVITNSQSILNKVAREIDYLVSDVERLVVEIEGNYKFKRLLSINKDNKLGIDNYEIAMGIQELREIKKYNYLIEDIILYYKKGDFFLNSLGLRKEAFIYDDYEKNIGVPYEEWREYLTDNYQEGKLVRIEKQIFYIITTPFREEVESSNIIIKVNTSKFEELINSYSNLNEGKLYIFDTDINEIATNSKGNSTDLEIEKSIISKLKDRTYTEDINLGKEKYLSLYLSGDKLDLQYVWLIQNKKLQQKSNYILIAFGSMGIIFILFLTLGIYEVRKNYKKISDIIERLRKNDLPILINQSEVSYINNALNTIEQKIENQEKVMVETTIRKALYGLVENMDENYRLLMKNNENLCKGQSIIAIFEEDTKQVKQAKELKLNIFVLENILKESLGEQVSSWIIPINDWNILVLNWDLEEEYELEYLLDSLESVRKFLEIQLDISYTIGISSPVMEISQLSIAYKEAIEALQEKQIIGNHQIIYYGNIQEHHNQYYYDEAMRKQLVNYIKLGDIEKSYQFIEGLYKENFEEKQISLECGKLFMIELLDTLIEIADEINYKIDIVPVDILKDFSTIYDMKKKIHKIIRELCNEGIKNKENNQDREEKILKYIQEHYQDINLNVAMIAEKFGLNASYLSRTFKEQTGENLLTYINSYRVEKAKELILNTNKSIINISAEIGFANVAALTRSFKKYEGVTPGQYKTIHKKE